ncbi:MAG: Wzz/FepE/Etk N-terminal domain-containing protein, partial [Perlucidibaca sp.]
MNTKDGLTVSPVDLSEGDDIDLREIIGVISEGRWTIYGFLFFGVLIGLLVAFLATPIYQVDGVVQVEDSDVSGLSASLDDLSSMFEGKAQAVTEIELMRSRMVLGKTVDDLGLDILIEPLYFPFLGRFYKPSLEPILAIGRLSVPYDWLDEGFILTAGESGHFNLQDPDGLEIGEGMVGVPFSSKDGRVQAFIRDLHAKPGQEFKVTKMDRMSTIDDLEDRLDLTEKGKLSGIIGMTLEDSDPVRAVKVLNQIANNYVRQNVERKSAEAQQTLKFLDQQLPDIKRNLEAAEVRFNEYRARTGTVDITKEGELLLQQSVEAETGLMELQQKRKELLSRFTAEHPSVQALDKQISAIQTQKEKFAGRVDGLPKTQQELLRLTRDLQVNQELYTQLLNNS